MGKTRICEQIGVQGDDSDPLVSPRIIAGTARHYTTISDSRPVDTINNNTINPSELSEVASTGRAKNSTQVTKTKSKSKSKSKSVSLQLRAAFATLAEIHLRSDISQLSFVTVNLSRKGSIKIVSEGGAPAYSKKVKRRFRNGLATGGLNLRQKPDFFLALEDSKDGSQHAHIIMRHHPDDEPVLKKMLRVEAKEDKNAVQFKTEYRLWLDAEPGSMAWQMNELDLMHDMAHGTDYGVYRRLGIRKGRVRFYRLMQVDGGAADYISKELGNALKGNPDALRLVIEGDIKARAKEIYKERYELKKHIKKKPNTIPQPATTQHLNLSRPSTSAVVESGDELSDEELFLIIEELENADAFADPVPPLQTSAAADPGDAPKSALDAIIEVQGLNRD